MYVTVFKASKMEKIVADLNGYLHDKFVVEESDQKIMTKCYIYDKNLAKLLCILTYLVTSGLILRPIIATAATGG